MSSRALFLELAALGADMRTGSLLPSEACRALPACELRDLKRRTREHKEGLKALMLGQGDKDLDAIREEGRR